MLNDTARGWQIDQLQKFIGILGRVVNTTSSEDARTIRDGGDGWTVNEVMGHLLDFEPIFLERAQLTVEEELADLPFPSPEELVVAGHFNERALRDLYEAWVPHRQNLVAYFNARAAADWERVANHPKRGRFSLESQLLLGVWHDTNHLEQMAHILDR